jgi:hypothetical protein
LLAEGLAAGQVQCPARHGLAEANVLDRRAEQRHVEGRLRVTESVEVDDAHASVVANR